MDHRESQVIRSAADWRSHLFPAGWLAVVGVLFQLFASRQERPLNKAALFLVVGGLCWALFQWARTRRVMSAFPTLVTGIVAGAALLVLGKSLVHGVGTFTESRKFGDVFHDQGQIAHRALLLSAQGVNPYGRRTMLDPIAFVSWVNVLARRPECGTVDPAATQEAFAEYWRRAVDSNRMLSLVPTIADVPACDDLRLKFQSLGYHYGPILLLSYLPFVVLLGPSGIYAVHLLAVLSWLAVLGGWLKKTLVRTSWVPALSAITLFLLAPSHVNQIFLQLSASDLVATILASASLLLWLQKRDLPAAFLLAASVGSKLFPGLLFAPLLLRNVRAALVFVTSAAAVYLPFALWDPAGLYHNLLYPFTIRDTTSPLAAMPQAAGTLLRLAAAGSFGAWIWRLATQGWPEGESLLFLVSIHLAALMLGGMSHNNYLIWAMAVIAIFWIRLVDRSGEPNAIRGRERLFAPKPRR